MVGYNTAKTRTTLVSSTTRNTSARVQGIGSNLAWWQHPPQLRLLLVGQRAGKHNVEVDPQVASATGRLHRMRMSSVTRT